MELSEIERDMLAEVGNIGAGHASSALSDLIGYEINVTVPNASMVQITELSDIVGAEAEMAVGVYIPVGGDIEGGVLLIIPQEDALKLSDILMGREIGTASELSEMDESSLKEVGNILVGNCLTALSRFLEMEMEEKVPEIAKDTPLAIANSIASRLGRQVDSALKVQEVMKIEEEDIELLAKFYLFFGGEGAETIIGSLKDKVVR